MEKIKWLIICCALQCLCNAQAKMEFSRLRPFIGPARQVVDTAYGDLNNDSLEDAVVITVERRLSSDPKAPRRLMVILNAVRIPKMLVTGDSVILNRSCSGTNSDAFTGMRVQGGNIVITHAGGTSWKWTQTTTFTYDKARRKMVLLRDEGITFDVRKPEKVLPVIYDKENFGKTTLDRYTNAYLANCR